MSDGLTITGRKQIDDGLDFYQTPEWATKLAVNQMIDDGIISVFDEILEPCSGAGAIVKVLEEYGLSLSASDIQKGKMIVGEKGVAVSDYENNSCDIVFTNPPYGRMTKENMLDDFLRIAKHKVILILNIFYLSSENRKKMLESSPLRHIYIHSGRVTMFPYGQEKPKNGGTKMFAWFVWDKDYIGKPTLSWI